MARVKRGLMRHKRHKKIIGKAKGYFGRKKNVFKNANEQVMKSGQYAYRDRRVRKRMFRRLWVTRISAACRLCDIRYSDLIHAMREKGVLVNRKSLSELAISDMDAFKSFVDQVMA